jgi:hypothetical protein
LDRCGFDDARRGPRREPRSACPRAASPVWYKTPGSRARSAEGPSDEGARGSRRPVPRPRAMRFRPTPTEALFAREAGHVPTQPLVPGTLAPSRGPPRRRGSLRAHRRGQSRAREAGLGLSRSGRPILCEGLRALPARGSVVRFNPKGPWASSFSGRQSRHGQTY